MRLSSENRTVRLLHVEDDARIRRALALSLADEGYDVVQAPSGETALGLLAEGGDPVDVILVDLLLPGLDGLAVTRLIRRTSDVPIIIVTALGESPDVIAGLEAGADDYVTKPLDAAELSARIRALLRRTRGNGHQHTLQVGDLQIDPARERVARAGAPVHLTKTEFRLLYELALAGGKVVSREELLSRVWQYDYFGDTRLLDVHIRRLRRKIESDPNSPTTIRTVRGVGYRVNT